MSDASANVPYSGAMRIVFIVGEPVAQVKAPAGLTRWFRDRGHDLLVVPAQVAPADFSAFLSAAERMGNCDGVIVTSPHKFAAHAACRAVDAAAARVGSVNLMRRHPAGGWFGTMTDGQGCVLGLQARGFDPRGKRALLIGAGGAGITVADALVQAGLGALRLVDIDPSRAEAARQTLVASSGFHPSIGPADATGFDLVVNATFLGTAAADALPLDVSTLSTGAVVADLACGPGGCTALVQAAAARGCLAMTGDEMFDAMCGLLGEFFLMRTPPDAASAVQRQDEPLPAERLRTLLTGYQATQTIHAAAMLRVADHLDDHTPQPVEAVAAAVGVHAGALYRLLRALAALGVFHEHEGHAFTLAPLGTCLRSDVTPTLGPWARFLAEPSRWRVWGHLTESVRTGETAFAAVHGMDCWEFRRAHPEVGALFHAAMAANSAHIDQAVVSACDLTGRRHLGDIGGGRGSLMAAFLTAYPTLQGTVFDQPAVVIEAEALLTAAGVRARCRVEGGDFWVAVPEGCDALLLKFILHDWDDARALALLKRCRAAVVPGAVLFVAEYLVGPPNTGLHVKMSDLNMFLGTGGRERTEAEYAALLEAAGFRYRHAVPTRGLLSVLVAEAC
jgi:shikimate 5-dehydrogenase